jgi:DNA repair protein RecN (Recombination protein N)
MLVSLRIKDLAIIDSLDIEFARGLNILTGETGAGKSIVLGALGLILGERASTEDVRSQCERARVEASFDMSRLPRVAAWLEAHGLDSGDGDLVIGREIHRSGKGRIFIMGALVPAATLRELGDLLVDIHGQHQHQSLLQAETHLEALDDFARDAAERERVAAHFAQWQAVRRRLADLSADERELERRKDMLAYQVREIEAAQLEAGEDTALAQERERLVHAETLVEAAATAEEWLIEGEHTDTTVMSLLSQIEMELQTIARHDGSMEPLLEELREERFKLEDLAARVREYRAALEADPQRLQAVEDRLDLIRQLKRKYGATIEEIAALLGENRRELERLENRDTEIAKVTAELERAGRALAESCEALSTARRAAAKQLEKGLVQFLADLNMPKTRFAVAFDRQSVGEGDGVRLDGRPWRVEATGVDRVEFLISPNPGEDVKPLRKIASGGEISRIMLALKSLIAKTDRIPTLVFDEIDVGIGGATADRVGEKIAQLAATHQIICITHLPQIAARADTHFSVEKKVAGGRTSTVVRRLDSDERTGELARMLGGAQVTEIGRRHAAQLIKSAKGDPGARSRK